MIRDHDLENLADLVAEKVAKKISKHLDHEKLLDARETAELLCCSVPTVERLTRSGELPSLKVGKLRRYRRRDLIQLEKHTDDPDV